MSVEKILKSVKFPTLSKTLNEIIELEKKNPVSIFNDMIKIIEKDPMLSVHIMKVANSPLLGFSKSVRSISHAVSLLGITHIRNIAFSFSIFDFIKKIKYSDKYGKTFKKIIKRSLMMSSISGILAKNRNKANSDELYISGLISNLGQIILFLYSPDKYVELYNSECCEDIIKAERKEFGTDFIEIGKAFCQKEDLPSFLESSIINQNELTEKTEINKIIFIASKITDFLLNENEETKEILLKKLDVDIKNILGLSIEDLQTTIKDLPVMMDSFMTDFPEAQSELNEIINLSSEIIINLMKKELDLVLQSKEQIKREKHIAGEKKFITHMLNLSKEFSALLQPEKLILTLLEYFKKNLNEYNIKILYKEKNKLTFFCINCPLKDKTIEQDSVLLLSKVIRKDEPQFGTKEDIDKLKLESNLNQIFFPISYHKNNFGFLILGIDNSKMKNSDYIISYIRIITNIIANAFQNYYSFVNIKAEKQKKEKIASELIKNDEKLINYESNETILSRSNVLEGILPVIFHKLKNKLTPILGYSQLVAVLSKDEKIVGKLRKIERNANELSNLLDLLRYTFKSERLVRKKENINEIIFRMGPYFSKIEEEERIIVDLELDHSIEDLLLNRGQIINLLMNLVENSVEALKNKEVVLKKIDIKTALLGDIVKLTVKDNGIGIEEENLLKVWAPFYSTSEKKAGIGLTASEKVLNNHKAKYYFDSKIGEGTEFVAEFPLKDLADDDKSINKNKKTTNSNILIIDDEETLVTLMKEILLIDNKWNIDTTTSGLEAIKMIDNNNYSLIISDIQMPEVSGMDIYNFMNKRGITDKLIMVTANPYINEIADFLKKNKIKYLKKPFELMEFRRLINEKI